MTDENEINVNGETEKSSPLPLKMIVEISPNTSIEQQIHSVIRANFLEQRSITWKPTKVELIVNRPLTEDFFVIRKKFEKASAGNRTEFEEHYGFLIENEQQINEICQNGYHCAETAFNVLGHSKYGIYVCKYADVCIRHASVRRTWEGNVPIKMIIFKIVEGKQTAALVRKGPKLQPIAPTPQFTSHCSVITPKETDDLEKQFDQSQIFLYEFEGREAAKRPHHCLPYAIVSLIQDGSQWPTSFDDSNTESNVLDTDTLRVIALSDDPLLQNKLKENMELAEAAACALEHVYEEEPPPPAPPVEQLAPTNENPETTPSTPSDNTNLPVTNGTGPASSSPPVSTEHPSATSSPANGVPSNNNEGLLISTVPPPPPPPPSSSSEPTSPSALAPAAAIANSLPPGHSAAALQAAYRQSGLLGALPGANVLRSASGGLYAAVGGLPNGLGGQLIYGGITIDTLRGFQTAGSTSPIAFATHAGQAMQQPALYAAQIQALAQQQQAAQLAAAAAAQQQQQQSLINGIPAGYTLVRTANGGYALLGQAPTATTAAAAIQQQQAQLQQQQQQQQYIAINAAGQPTAVSAARFPAALAGGQPQQLVYQYAGQPTMQAAPTQYIQMPASYAQQQGLSSANSVMQATNSTSPQAYISQQPTHYIGASQSAASANTNGTPTNSSSGIQPQSTPPVISPQKQSAASATAAALQQQQQYQHAYSPQQQQQQQQQQAANGAAASNLYYAAMAQAQQQQLGFMPQMQFAAQSAAPQQFYYTSTGGQTIYQAGGQSYVLAQAAPTAGSVTTTGAPMMYSAGPVLHNGAAQQSAQSQQQQQQQLAYQIAAAAGQPAGAAYQVINATSNPSMNTTQQSTPGPGVVAQQPAQLVQRSNVLPQVRHHPYRS